MLWNDKRVARGLFYSSTTFEFIELTLFVDYRNKKHVNHTNEINRTLSDLKIDRVYWKIKIAFENQVNIWKLMQNKT